MADADDGCRSQILVLGELAGPRSNALNCIFPVRGNESSKILPTAIPRHFVQRSRETQFFAFAFATSGESCLLTWRWCSETLL
jgi:hypothetical protein